MKLIPRNWREFQHYKDRNPPWIRLHRGLLDNKDFHRLPVVSRALAPMLWLIASESVDGVINADNDDLAFRLRCTEKEIAVAIRPLIDAGFFVVEQDASTVLADGSQVAVPEALQRQRQRTEAEALSEAEASQVPGRSRAKRSTQPAPSSGVWLAYSTAYEQRYGATPVRNAKVNAQLAQVVGRIGEEESPQVAAWFIGHNARWYVQQGHSVDCLLRDCEKLRTEWATGRQVTSASAVLADRTQTNLNAFAGMLDEARQQEIHDGKLEAA